MIITITEKPQVGKLQRVCKACGESYYGWDFALCHACADSKIHTVELEY